MSRKSKPWKPWVCPYCGLKTGVREVYVSHLASHKEEFRTRVAGSRE